MIFQATSWPSSCPRTRRTSFRTTGRTRRWSSRLTFRWTTRPESGNESRSIAGSKKTSCSRKPEDKKQLSIVSSKCFCFFFEEKFRTMLFLWTFHAFFFYFQDQRKSTKISLLVRFRFFKVWSFLPWDSTVTRMEVIIKWTFSSPHNSEDWLF